MDINLIGGGCWGFCLAQHLIKQGHRTTLFVRNPALQKSLIEHRRHPLFPLIEVHPDMKILLLRESKLTKADLFVEATTASGFKHTANLVAEFPDSYFAITSKGLDLETGKILPEIGKEIFGPKWKNIGILSGPGYAEEVIRGLPTSLVASGFSPETTECIRQAFQSPVFRVYPNSDILGVAYGGALKNIMAIACGIAEGLGAGASAKAAVITRGLHEMRKLAVQLGALPETLNGLSGMGDLVLTCSSMLSRNFRLGVFLAEGYTLEKAKEKIGTVAEGAMTAEAALSLAKRNNIPLPITEMVVNILQGNIRAEEAIALLMQRTIKEESL